MKSENNYPGVLIVFEGIDGSGKTTITKKILGTLKKYGYDVILISEPTDGQYGQMLRNSARKKGARFSPEKEKELFVKDRQENTRKNIIPSLKKGKIVLMDRYYISTMAYQGARGLDVNEIREESEQFAPIPDMVFILDIPVDTGLKRISDKRGDDFDLFENKSYLESVRNNFLSFSFYNLYVIDASQPIELLEQEVITKITGFLESRDSGRL